ncbi:MAG: hypothetical protein VXZ40_00855 [Nanoarchaeota archaeon]|nr:hypothetical protein [Nanoarchaeota archaeon]
METIEIIVYVGVALLIIGIGLNFIIDIDGERLSSSFKELIGVDTQETSFQRVDSLGLIEEIYTVWELCGKGEIPLSKTVYLEDDKYAEISKGFIFSKIRQINYCTQLQSAEFSCGDREDLELENDEIPVPSIIEISCSDSKINLII